MSNFANERVPPKASNEILFTESDNLADGVRRVSGPQGRERSMQTARRGPSRGGNVRGGGRQSGHAQRDRGRGRKKGGGGGDFVQASGDRQNERQGHREVDGDRGGGSHSRAVATGGGRNARGSSTRFVSANHLLNFKYDSRPPQGGRTRSMSGGGGGSRFVSRNTGKRNPYNKDEFLQANFRFLVSDSVDVGSFVSEADKMFDWGDVVQVEMMVTSPAKCPISLDSPPIAPQITPCGHVFAFSSIMQHLMVHGGPKLRCAAPCPLCFTQIVARELRSVVFHQVVHPKDGDLIRFQLLKRNRSSIIPEAIGKGQVDGVNYDEGLLLRCNRFAKFTTVGEPLDVWRKDAEELAKTAAEVVSAGGIEATLEGPALYAALDALALRAKTWTVRRAEKLSESSPQIDPVELGMIAEKTIKDIFTGSVSAVAHTKQQAEMAEKFNKEFPALNVKSSIEGSVFEPAFSDEEGEIDEGPDPPLSTGFQLQFGDSAAALSQSPPTNALKDASDALSSSPATTHYDSHAGLAGEHHFYQSIDGQWMFLHPANVKCLMQQFGSYVNCPSVIQGRVVEMDDMVQGEGVRRRYKNLAHLPNKGAFKLVEIDLNHLISPENLEPILQRKEMRQKKAQREKRRQKREKKAAQAAENAARPPTIEEFKAMPKVSELVDPLGINSGSCLETAEDDVTVPVDGGVSWSAVTKLGIAASWNAAGSSAQMDSQFPALSMGSGQHQPTQSTPPQSTPDPKPSHNPWNPKKNQSPLSQATFNQLPQTESMALSKSPSAKGSKLSHGKKNKKPGKTLLFAIGQKRG